MARRTAKINQKTTTKKAASKMAVKGTKTAPKAAKREGASAHQAHFFGLPLTTWIGMLRKAKGAEARSGRRGMVYIFGHRDNKSIKRVIGSLLTKWQWQTFEDSSADSAFFQGTAGPVWIIRAQKEKTEELRLSPATALEKSASARIRDLAGAIVPQLGTYKLDKLILEFHDVTTSEERSALLGMEMASYNFQENRIGGKKARKTLPQILVKESSSSFSAELVNSAADLALSVNLARHLVNLPSAELNPRSYAGGVRDLFSGFENVSVEIWEGEKLEREKMNLLMAVGGAAEEKPRFVHIRYRPSNRLNGAKPVAIVGKGVTFDSGGLDIKPSSAMRWMKKDMGGSAGAVGTAFWAARTGLPIPLDIYLSLAENAISGSSFRPGDIITARNGMTVEIHNTDAEGRLVLADALDVAVTRTGADEPSMVINLATLTGAIKVGLGAEIAGLFSNNDDLSNLLFDSGLVNGDLMWRMPLFQPYRSALKSTFAEVANASDGFGGAITAALFLESFVNNVPWAHLDIYAWKDSAGGAWSESGGNGQPVQALATALTKLAAGR